ncbi:hypothetical protein RQP46_004568 [Phenoliferia psychrophenolica]
MMQMQPTPQGKMEIMSDGNEAFLRAQKYVGLPNRSQRACDRRRKPTDRSLPSFVTPSASTPTPGPTEAKLEESTKSLQSMAESYKRLQAVERKLDWNVSRRKVELSESLSGSRFAGIKRTLRVHLSTKLIDQPWQVPLADVTAPPARDAVRPPTPPVAPTLPIPVPTTASPSAPADISVDGAPKNQDGTPAGTPAAEGDAKAPDDKMDLSGEGVPASGTPISTEGDASKEIPIEPSLAPVPAPEPTPVLAPDFVAGTGIPRFEMTITGELLPAVGSGQTESESEGWTRHIKRLVVEFPDRDVHSYDKVGPIDWRRPSSSAPSALTFSLPSSTATPVRISLYIAHRPDYFALIPEVAMMLDMAEGDRVTVIQALWGYVRVHGLVDDERKNIRCDGMLRKIFGGQDKVPFHHLPEYVNRFLVPPHPTVLEYVIKTDVSAGETAHTAFDIQTSVDDPARTEMERVAVALNNPDARLKEIAALDEKIAAEAILIKQTHLKRSFLTAFASSPQAFLARWVASQATDLDVILPGGSASKDDMRRADQWQGDWVKEGATVHTIRATEQSLREAKIAQQQQMQQQQQQQQQFGQQQQQQQYARR